MEQPSYWFPAKRHGWGWGPPSAWQGWVVLVVFFCLLAAGAAILLPIDRISAFLGWSVFLTVVLVAICWVKGEPPSPRSGK
ncbi:MAG: hypothetical protein ABI624_02890 [Casimicrobiaceae bacterium]